MATEKPSPEMLTELIKAQEAVIDSYRQSDPTYWSYIKRHRRGWCRGPLLYPDAYYTRTAELRALYDATTAVLQFQHPENYDSNLELIAILEKEVGA